MSSHVYITSIGVIAGNKTGSAQKEYKIQTDQYEPLLQHFQTRNIDRISKISLAAAALTLMKRNNKAKTNIAMSENNDFGIILGTQFSALKSIHSFDMDALEKGALAVNPGLFPNTVLNAPACQASIQYSFAGPVYTVCNGLTSSLDAIGLGYNFVRTGLCPMVMAGGADEIAELQTMIKPEDRDLGEAGGFLLLEGEKTEGNRRAEMIGYKSIALHVQQRKSLAESVSKVIIDTVAAGGNKIADAAYISFHSVFSSKINETVFLEICKILNYNNQTAYMETDWMGACGIVQAESALRMIDNASTNVMCVLVNIDFEKVSVLAIKSI